MKPSSARLLLGLALMVYALWVAALATTAILSGSPRRSRASEHGCRGLSSGNRPLGRRLNRSRPRMRWDLLA